MQTSQATKRPAKLRQLTRCRYYGRVQVDLAALSGSSESHEGHTDTTGLRDRGTRADVSGLAKSTMFGWIPMEGTRLDLSCGEFYSNTSTLSRRVAEKGQILVHIFRD